MLKYSILYRIRWARIIGGFCNGRLLHIRPHEYAMINLGLPHQSFPELFGFTVEIINCAAIIIVLYGAVGYGIVVQ